MTSRPKRLLLAATGVLLGLGGLGLGLLHLPATLSFARDAAVDATNGALRGTLAIGEVRGSLFGELTIEDVELRTPGGERVVGVDELRASVELGALLRRGVAVDVQARGVTVFARRGVDGTINLLEALPAPTDEPSAALPVWLDLRILLSDATVIWRDEQAPPSGADPLDRLGPQTARAEVTAAVAEVAAPAEPMRAAPRTVVLDDLSSSVRVGIGRQGSVDVGVRELQGNLAAAPLTASRALALDRVDLALAADGGLRLELAELTLADWASIAGLRADLPADPTRLAAEVRGVHARKELLGALVPEAGIGQDLRVQAAVVPGGAGGLAFDLRLKPGEFDEVLVAGEIDDGWREPGPDTRWALSLSAPTFPAAEVSTAAWPIAKLTAHVVAQGQGVDPQRMQARARVGVRAATIDRYRVENAYAELQIEDGQLRVEEVHLQTPYASAAASGSAGRDGTFAVRARARASDEMAALVASLFGRKLDTRADVDLAATGKVDLAADDPLGSFEELDATLAWDVRAFNAEDIVVRASRGRIEAEVATANGQARVRLDGQVRAEGVQAEGARLGALRLDVRADSRLETAEPNVLETLRRMTARVDVDVDDLVSGATRVRALHLLARVAPRGEVLRYDLTASGSQVRAGETRVADVALDLSGDLTPGSTLAWPGALQALRVRGTAGARGLALGTDAVSAVQAQIDVGGPVGDLRGTVSARTDGLALGGYTFESLAAQVQFVGSRNFVVDATGVQKDRSPAEVQVSARGRYNAQLNDFEVLDLRFKSLGEDWNMTDGFSVDTKSGTVRFDDVTLTHGAQRVAIKGRYRQGKDQELQASIASLDLAQVVADFGLPGLEPLRGTLDATAEVGGTSAAPTARFDLRLRDLYWGELGPFELQATGRYGERELTVETLALDGWGVRLLQGDAILPLRIEATGAFEVLQAERVQASLETPLFELGRLQGALPTLEEWGVEGKVAMTSRLRGTLLQPSFNVDVRTDGLRGRVTVDEDRLEVGPVTSSVAARFDDPDGENGGFEVAINAQWADQAPMQLLARIRADVAAWLRETLDGRDVDWAGRAAAAPWRFVGQASRFDLRKLRVGALRQADVEGFLTLQIIGDGSLASPQANFEIELTEFGWDRYRDVFVDANIAVEPERLLLKTARLEWDAAEIATASGAIPVPFRSLFGDAPLDDLPIDFRVEITRTPLAKLSAVDYSFASLRGTFGGFASFGGTLQEPTAEVRMALEDVEFADRSTGGVAMDLALSRSDTVNGRVLWTRAGAPTLTATIAAPLDVNIARLIAGEPLQASGQFEAELVGAAVPIGALVPRRVFDHLVADLAGRLDADLRISGTVEQPTLGGTVKISDGGLTLPELGRSFREVAVDLQARPEEAIVLRRFHVSGERGTVDASGTLGLAGWKPGVVNGAAEVRNFGTMGFTDEAMFVSADIDLGGDFSAKPATARAVVSGLEVVVPSTDDMRTHPTGLDPDIVVVRSAADRQALEAVEGVVEPVSTVPYLELAVEIAPGARVRHPLAEVEARGDVRVALSDAGPVLYGEVSTTRGSAQFLGKKFRIAEAVVTFTGQDPPDPRLQIEAVYALDRSITRSIGQPTSGEPRAITRITGRLSDPRIRFLSDPAMPESDVIYVLLTNRPPDRGEVGETGLATGAASGLLTGLIADSPVGQVFDVRFEAGEQGFSDASIEVGRHIGPDVFISVDFIGGAQPNENSSELNIEYRFLPRWIFEFKAGNRATGEANVFWDIY